jgi:drug/metabolite transporter (DMT)-like permease
MYLLLALAAAAAYGAADFLGGVASRRSPVVPVIIASQGLALLLILLVAPLMGGVPSAVELAWGAAAGLAYACGLVLLYRALADGRMSVVAPITGVCAPSLPVIFGLAIGERPGLFALTGVVLAIVAILLVSRAAEPIQDDTPEEQSASTAPSTAERERQRRVVLMAVGAGVAMGVFFIALGQTRPESGLWPLVATRALTVLCYLAVVGFTRQSLRLPRASLQVALLGGALDICANTLFLFAVRSGLISLAATVTSLYPATTIVLASLVLRERLRRVQLMGLACAAAALLMITSTH